MIKIIGACPYYLWNMRNLFQSDENSMNDPLVSVYISTHNRLDKLKKAIDSVRNQDYEKIEIIVCDDASDDGTKNYISNLSKVDSRVRYFRNETNKGACVARNLGIDNANGKFITGLDDDDEFTVDRISAFLRGWDDKYSFICCDFIEKFSDGTEKTYYKKEKIITINDILFENEASNQVFTLTSRMRAIGGFDKRARRLQDWDTWIRLVSKFGEGRRFSNATYIMYHDHDVNAPRVSKSYSLVDAFKDLFDRNQDLYSMKNKFVMNYIISCLNKKANLHDAIKSFLIIKKPSMIFKYIKSKLI